DGNAPDAGARDARPVERARERVNEERKGTMEIQTSSGRFSEADVQALAVAVFKDEKADEGFLKDIDAAAGGLVRSVLESEELKGKEGETAYLHLSPSGGGMK